MQCRAGCSACCIAPSISSAIPGMPDGKPAGVRCIQLNNTGCCALYGQPERPAVCVKLPAEPATCGDSRGQALAQLAELELITRA